MNRKEILERLRGLIARSARDVVDRKEVFGENDTMLSIGIDSLAMLDFLYDVQQEFRIEFDPQDLAAVTTVGELAAFVEKRMAA
jgi:acyl carrier protein